MPPTPTTRSSSYAEIRSPTPRWRRSSGGAFACEVAISMGGWEHAACQEARCDPGAERGRSTTSDLLPFDGTLAHQAVGKVSAPTAVMMYEPLAELGPNSVVGSYRIVKESGRGGMGTVYEAMHTLLPRRAALKVMHGELRRQPGMATRVVQEASILEEVRHPGIVRVYDASLLADHRPWIAMELVEG